MASFEHFAQVMDGTPPSRCKGCQGAEDQRGDGGLRTRRLNTNRAQRRSLLDRCDHRRRVDRRHRQESRAGKSTRRLIPRFYEPTAGGSSSTDRMSSPYARARQEHRLRAQTSSSSTDRFGNLRYGAVVRPTRRCGPRSTQPTWAPSSAHCRSVSTPGGERGPTLGGRSSGFHRPGLLEEPRF